MPCGALSLFIVMPGPRFLSLFSAVVVVVVPVPRVLMTTPAESMRRLLPVTVQAVAFFSFFQPLLKLVFSLSLLFFFCLLGSSSLFFFSTKRR